MAFSTSRCALVFKTDISTIGSAVSTSQRQIPEGTNDLTVKRGLFGHYLSREVKHKAGDVIRPQHWLRNGDNILFWTKDLSFSVPMSSVELKTESGKIIQIHPKNGCEVDSEVVATEGVSHE